MTALGLNDDQTWIEEVVRGNERAFKILFDKYHHKLGRYIYQLTNSSVLAEDVVQDVFLKIWLNRKSLAGVSNFAAYLFTASRNHALNAIRKQVNKRTSYEAWKLEQPLVTESDNHEEQLYADLIEQAVEQLPAQQRRVYILSKRMKLKQADIAKEMKISPETVKKYLKIARASIIRYIKNYRKSHVISLLLNLFRF